jgi:aspartyl/asparaginyl beta-hydroxylase (cupin superfamily)
MNPEATAPPVEDQATHRFHKFIDAYVDPAANNNLTIYPDLATQAWYDASMFPIVGTLEASSETILRELAAVHPADFHREVESIQRQGSWDVLMLYARGKRHDENCAKLPAAARIVEEFATIRTLAGLIYFSRMLPDTHIAAHRGPTNLRVRCHLPLVVPEGDCRLRVGDETRSWEFGKCLVFSDFIEHEAWNRTLGPRIVLIVDLWHPDLSQTEVRMLERFYGRILRESKNLHKYWANNDGASTSYK